MKQVINITLGKIVFAIEQDAYDALSKYLTDVKSNLASDTDASEIVADVEIAIAEKFLARKRSEKMAVTNADVAVVIKEMGSAGSFGEGNAEASQTTASDTSKTEEPKTEKSQGEKKRRLYRDTEDSVLAGVASGLAQYFGIDPVIVRLIFVVSIFFNGLGILAYIILWLVVPKAETTAEKYAMRGEKVTVEEIKQQVKKIQIA